MLYHMEVYEVYQMDYMHQMDYMQVYDMEAYHEMIYFQAHLHSLAVSQMKQSVMQVGGEGETSLQKWWLAS